MPARISRTCASRRVSTPRWRSSRRRWRKRPMPRRCTMRRADRRSQHFVRTLLSGGEARRNARGEYAAGDTKLLAAAVAELMSAGVLAGDRAACRATPEARTWLKRALLDD